MMVLYREREKQNMCCLYECIENNELKQRVKVSLEWYIEKAAKYRRYFYTLSFISILMPLLITVLNNVCVDSFERCYIQNAITICSVFTTLATSILALFKFQEKWILYRSTAEEIKKELSLFSAKKCGDINELNLISKIEECMSKERAEWFVLSNDKSEKKEQEEKEKGKKRKKGK